MLSRKKGKSNIAIWRYWKQAPLALIGDGDLCTFSVCFPLLSEFVNPCEEEEEDHGDRISVFFRDGWMALIMRGRRPPTKQQGGPHLRIF
jgi:hypothetical protein